MADFNLNFFSPMLSLPLVDRVVEQLKATMNGSDDSAWLLAASGGRDSTMLAHLLRQAKIPCALAHMNYGLRGEESVRDERFVRDLALHLGVPVYVECVDAAPMIGNRQAICRKLRYNWLHKLCLEHSFIGILTAHHAGDQAETVLMALLKGRGLRARAGMDFTVGRVYRPLLTTSSEEIEEWVTDNEIEYMVDSSNRSLRYDRNYVRHVLTPLLNARFPNWQLHLLERSSVWRSYSNKLEQSALVESHRIIVEDAHGLMRWNIIDSIPTDIYLEMARKLIPNRNSLLRLGDLLEGAPNRQLTAGDWMISRTSHALIWERLDVSACDSNVQDTLQSRFPIELNNPGVYALSSNQQLLYRVWTNALERSNSIVEGGESWIEASMHLPCIVRCWQAGDRIRMAGSGGRKKVSDLLNECAVPPVRRRSILVLVQGNEILSVLGYRSFSFVGSPEEYPRQAFRLCSVSDKDASLMANNPSY